MKVEIGDNYEYIMREVYNGITLITDSDETLSICMRDYGFEFVYEGVRYSAQKGKIKKVEKL